MPNLSPALDSSCLKSPGPHQAVFEGVITHPEDVQPEVGLRFSSWPAAGSGKMEEPHQHQASAFPDGSTEGGVPRVMAWKAWENS